MPLASQIGQRLRGPSRLAGMLALSALAAVEPSGAACAQSLTSDQAAAIDALVNEVVARGRTPGVSLVVTRGGAIVYLAGYGVTGAGDPMGPDTPMYIGSASKSFTAFAVMQLVDEGRIELDATVRSQLPEFATADPRSADITVRQLLSHTSGMADVEYQEWSLPAPGSLEAAVARLQRTHLAKDPGEAFSYHNPNYYVAARLVETASGRPFGAYMQERVFTPLGMTHTTTVDFIREARDGAPLGHIAIFDRAFPMSSPPFLVNGAGGVLTTATDMGAWLIAQAGGGAGPNGLRLLSAEGLAETHAPSIAPNYGLGWNVHPDGRISHSGGLPTFSAYVTVGEGGDGVAVLANVANSPAREIALGVVEIMAGRAPTPIGRSPMSRIDAGLAAVIAIVLAVGGRDLLRVGPWIARRRSWPRWRIALSFAPNLAVVLLVVWGIPFLVSRAESWSWVWMAYWFPVATALLVTLATFAALVASARTAVLVMRRIRGDSPSLV